MAISSKELAELLGVSASAVSLALNGNKGISDETRERILVEAEKYGIQRNRKKKPNTNRIVFLIYKKPNYSDSPFLSGMLEGISTQATEQGCNLQVFYYQERQNPQEQIRAAGLSDCAGMILLANEMTRQDLDPFMNVGRPLVVLDNCFEMESIDCVAVNNAQGAYLAARHLLEKGHCQLGRIHADLDIRNFKERRNGFLQAVEESGLHCNIQHIQVGSTPEGAYEDMARYLDALGDKPLETTGFFADSDVIAVSCMQALQKHGYRVPEDISIVGFGNLPIAYATVPGLTTIQSNVQQLGSYAVQCLMDNINGGETYSHVTLRLGTTLVQRDSVREL